MKDPNYRDLFVKMADFVYSQISIGNCDIEGALDILRGVLKGKDASSTLIQFEKKDKCFKYIECGYEYCAFSGKHCGVCHEVHSDATPNAT